MMNKIKTKVLKYCEIPILHKFGIVLAIILIIRIISLQLIEASYSIIEKGSEPYIGGDGLLLVFLFVYIILTIAHFAKNERLKSTLTFSLLLPIPLLYIYCDIYSNYSDNLEQKFIKQSHKRVGIVYSKERPGYRSHHYTVRTGIDSTHTREQRVPKGSPLLKTIHIGDTVILQVSDEYPRVNKVLDWQPTSEKIEKYRNPVQFVETKK